MLELPEGTRFQVLAPVVRGRKGEYAELFRELQTKGYSRARVDGETVSLAEPPKLDKKLKHTIDVVVDRLVVKPSRKRRLTDSVETALGLAGGLVTVDFVDLPEDSPDRERRFSEKLACPNEHPLVIDELEPRSFSFNSPFGACPECTGLGTRLEVDPELLVPDDGLIARRGRGRAVGRRRTSAEYFQRLLEALGRGPGLHASTRRGASCRSGRRRPSCTASTTRCTSSTATATAGSGPTTPASRARSRSSSAGTPRPSRDWSRERYEGYMREVPCPACKGARLKPESLAVPGRRHGRSPTSARCRSARPTSSCATLELTDRERQIAERVLKEIHARLGFLLDVGLDYLSLDRPSGTLSGGEAQRIRLATQIGVRAGRRALRARRAVASACTSATTAG